MKLGQRRRAGDKAAGRQWLMHMDGKALHGAYPAKYQGDAHGHNRSRGHEWTELLELFSCTRLLWAVRTFSCTRSHIRLSLTGC